MQCRNESTEAILAYTAGTLEPAEQIKLEEHLSSCEACRSVAARQREVWHLLNGVMAAPVSADFDDRLFARIAADKQTSWWERLAHYHWSWTLRPAIPIAAASAALLLGFMIRQPFAVSSHHQAANTSEVKVSIEQVERALDDMDMLKQIGVTSAASSGESRQKL